MTLRRLATDPLVGLVGAITGVAVVVLGIAFLTARDRVPVPPDGPDASAPPQAVGGTVSVEGDRTGTLLLDRMHAQARYAEDTGPDTVRLDLGDVQLTGPDGRITFSRDTSEGVTEVVYDGLTFYVDPGDCTLTSGAHNPAAGLVGATLACDPISDIRGGGTISLSGLVALPADLFGVRGDVPASGGRLVVGQTPIDFAEAAILIGPSTLVSGRTPAPLGGGEPPTIVGIEYNAESGEYFASGVHAGGDYASGQPCRLDVEPLGTLSPQASAVRLTFDCQDFQDAEGQSLPVEGELVVDVFEPSG